MKKENNKGVGILFIIGVVALLIISIVNVYALSSLSNNMGFSGSKFAGGKDIANVDLTSIHSTGQAVATLFPVDKIKTQQEAIDVLVPSGTPEYGEALGISFDDPVGGENKLAKLYPQIKNEAKQDPVLWQRYMNLATKPVGISCEFCCGIGPIGIDGSGELKCGCAHNPAIQALTMWLMKNTDYSDAEILREDLKWKTLWFPKDMIQLGLKAAGGEINLNDLPGQVGGC